MLADDVYLVLDDYNAAQVLHRVALRSLVASPWHSLNGTCTLRWPGSPPTYLHRMLLHLVVLMVFRGLCDRHRVAVPQMAAVGLL